MFASRARPGDSLLAELLETAALVQKLSVMLAAGLSPGAGWRFLADASLAPPVHRAADAAEIGADVGEAIVSALGQGGSRPSGKPGKSGKSGLARAPRAEGAGEAWRGIAAAWMVATDAGAPLAATLSELAQSLRELARVQRAVGVALAAPRATARLILWLPAIGLLFSVALGFDSLRVLVATVPGIVCAGAGIALILAAAAWNRALVTAAVPASLTPGLALDLLAIALAGGASVPRARTAVAEAVSRCALEASEPAIANDILDLAERAGIPPGALLRSEAAECRREAWGAGDEAAARLGVTLMIPLGVCVLPAFLLLTVAPIVLAVISSTSGGR